MANEITIRSQMTVRKGSLRISRAPSLTFDMDGSHYSANAQTIGTTEEALVIAADVAFLGQGVLVNTDETNFVEIGVKPAATFYPLHRLYPGEHVLGRFSPAAVPYAKADTAPVVLEHIIAES